MTSAMEKLQEVMYPVALKKGSKKGEQYIVRTDNDEKISLVSDRYTLVPNETLMTPFLKHFGEQNLVNCVPKAKACLIEIETGRSFDFGKGDLIRERLIVQNSYDRTRSYKFMFGAFRLVCTNGLYTGMMSIQYRKIHVGEIPVEEMIKNVLKDYKSNKFDLWRKMSKTPIDVKVEVAMINKLVCLEVADDDKDKNSQYRNFAINEKIKESAAEYVNRVESVDNQRTVWGLYNQITRAIATQLRGKYMMDKKILANKLAEDYLAKKFNLN